MKKEQYIKEAIEALNEANLHEPEYAHQTGDEILCELLVKLGYKEVVDVYNKSDKWYA